MDMRETCIQEFFRKAKEYIEEPKLPPEQNGMPAMEIFAQPVTKTA